MTVAVPLDAIRIDAGGVPTDEELAAMVATLGAMWAAGQGRRRPRDEQVTSAWLQAALLEGVGVGQVVGPAGLRTRRLPTTTVTARDRTVRGWARPSPGAPQEVHPGPWPRATGPPPPAARPR